MSLPPNFPVEAQTAFMAAIPKIQLDLGFSGFPGQDLGKLCPGLLHLLDADWIQRGSSFESTANFTGG